jgi:hypothetical protein
MKRILQLLVIPALVVMAAACADTTTTPLSFSSVSDAFLTTPVGFDQVTSSFVPTSNLNDAFVPPPPGQGRGGPGMGGCMGGGIGDAFVGGIGFGPGIGRGPFGDAPINDSNCTYSASTGRITCPPLTVNGLTILRSAAYLTVSGASQAKFDTATTNSANVQIDVSGTVVHHNSDTSVVHNTSNRTVTGLASGSTQRTVNGTSAGTETTHGTNPQGAFTASRVAGDTTTGLVIPILAGKPTYPTAGTVVRSMQATVTIAGGTPANSSRREVITYNGTATANVTVTQDGVTKSCTMPLPHGHLSCQ